MRRDLEKYLLDMQAQYNQMEKVLDKARQEASEGLITQEQADQISAYYATVMSNFQRVNYCRYLLNLPPKFIQKLRAKKTEAQMKKYIEQHADVESVKEENKKAIESVEAIVDEVTNA